MLVRWRERILRTMRFHYPDRIPVCHSYLPAALIKHREHLLDLFRRYPSDFAQTYEEIDLSLPEYQPEENYTRERVDECGSVMREENKGYAGYVVKPVLEDWKNYE